MRVHFAVVESFALMLIDIQELVGVEQHVTIFREPRDSRWCLRFAQRGEGVAVGRAVGMEIVLLELIKRQGVRQHSFAFDDQ